MTISRRVFPSALLLCCGLGNGFGVALAEPARATEDGVTRSIAERAAEAAGEPLPEVRSSRQPYSLGEAWFNDIGVRLDVDRDRDGYFSRFVLSLDVDQESWKADGHESAHDAGLGSTRLDVYVRLGLYDGDGRELLVYDSNTFEVSGTSSYEDYRIEIELLDDYPADAYDLVLELRDRRTDVLLDVVDGGDFRTLRNLPLEDARRDGHVRDDGYGGGVSYYVGASSHGDNSYAAVEYAGGLGPFGLLAAGMVLAYRRRATSGSVRGRKDAVNARRNIERPCG